jgi:hypothetical protein
MELELKRHIMTDLGQEYCELLEGHELNEHVYGIMKEKVRNEYDSEIWEMVDSEENEDEFDFDDILYEIMIEVETLGNYYFENNQKGDN